MYSINKRHAQRSRVSLDPDASANPPAKAVCAQQSQQEGQREGPFRDRRAIDSTTPPAELLHVLGVNPPLRLQGLILLPSLASRPIKVQQDVAPVESA